MLGKGVLPSEVDEQDPIDLMEALFALTDAYINENEYSENDEMDYEHVSPILWPE